MNESQRKDVERVFSRLRPDIEKASSELLHTTARRGGQKERVARSRNRLKDLEEKMKENPGIKPLVERERALLSRRETDLTGAMTDQDITEILNAAEEFANERGSLIGVIHVLRDPGWRQRTMKEMNVADTEDTYKRLHDAVIATLTGIADTDPDVKEWAAKDRRRFGLIVMLDEQYGIN